MSPQHDYAHPGTYDVTLTVTDDDGDMGPDSHVIALAPHIQAVGPPRPTGALRSPSGCRRLAAAGDTAVLFATHNAVDPNLAAVPGWTLEDTRTSVGMVTTVWSRTLAAGDAGSNVTVTADRALRTTLSLAVYRGVTIRRRRTGHLGSRGGDRDAHDADGDDDEPTWVLSYFADKSSGTTAWTPPPATQTRAEAYTVGGGRVTSLLVDADAAVPAGSVGGLTATTDVAGTRAVVMTVVLAIATP